MQYIKFDLTPGQQSPVGSTGIALSSGWIVWVGEEGTFNENAIFGTILPGDTQPSPTIIHQEMTSEEIQEYEDILAEEE